MAPLQNTEAFSERAAKILRIAGLAVVDPTAGTNPVPFTEADVMALLRDMHDGILLPID